MITVIDYCLVLLQSIHYKWMIMNNNFWSFLLTNSLISPLQWLTYSFEINWGPAHNRRYIRVLQIETGDGIVQMSGDEKSKVKDADNSAA